MSRTIASMLVALLLAGMLIACGGSSEATPTATPVPALAATATSPSTAAAPTATQPSPSPTPTAVPSPTQASASTPAPAPAPTRLIATAVPTRAAATPTPEPEDDVVVLIGYAALTEGDLGGDWVLESTEIPDLDQETLTGICGQPRFVDRYMRTGALRLDFSNNGLPARLTQDIVAFPYSTAFSAMDYAREIVGACTEWTEEDGTAFEISVLEDPLLGDEALAAVISFVTPEGVAIDGYLVFVREDEYLTSLSYLTLAGGDFSPVPAISQTASAKLFAAAESFFHPEFDADFLAQSAALLLTSPDLADSWTLAEYAIPTDSDRFGVCDALAFPDEYLARSEISARFQVDPENGPFFSHSLVALDDAAIAGVAMSYIRDSSSCADWTDPYGDYYVVVDRPTVDLGDESYAVIFENEADGYGTVNIELLYVRTGSIVTVITYAQIGQIDAAQVRSIAELAVAKLGR
jgi:hypothetical protein